MADSNNNNFSSSFLSGLGSGIGNFAGGLLDTFTGGIFTHRQNKRQERLIREQNEFNAREAQKQRDWQELMQQLYGTVQAKADQYRSAGLNAQLAGIQSDSVGSGASATASESLPPQNEYNGGLSGLRSVGSDIVSSALSSQSVSSQTSLNKTMEGLNMANKELSEANKALTEENTAAARQIKSSSIPLYCGKEEEPEKWRQRDRKSSSRPVTQER
jgi:FtsZ-binding cell division protein ZapB